MKFVAFILAVIVLALSIMPCNDNDVLLKAGKANTEISKKLPADNHSNSTDDNCSPFCMCNCCSGFTFSFAYYQAAAVIAPVIKKTTAHISSKVNEMALPIWQPPQLS